jgi:hypothetical protein
MATRVAAGAAGNGEVDARQGRQEGENKVEKHCY